MHEFMQNTVMRHADYRHPLETTPKATLL
jgi:hypothetical protein